MATLQERVTDDWKEAMKARNPSKDTLSLIRTELKNKAINTRSGGDQGTHISDEIAVDVLSKMAKQRKESIDSYKTGGRPDLVEKENLELAVIEKYLPKQLTEAEIQYIVDEVIKETGATSIKELGKVMGAVVAKTKGRADGGQVQALVKAKLGV